MIDVDDIAEVPEKYRDQYAQVKDGDKTIWRNKAFIAVKEANEKYKGRAAELGEKASAYEKLQAEIEAKRIKDEADRIASLHDKKDYKSLLDELTQKYSDLEKRSGETQKQFDERVSNLHGKISTKAVESVISDLAELATDDGKKSFKRLVKDRIKYDPEAEKYTFLDDDGGVTSLDLAGFRREIEDSDMYAPLLKAKTSVGGHGRNAKSGGGASLVMKRSDFEAKSPAERAEFMRQGGKLKD